MAEKPHSRRRFLKYAGAGVLAAAAGIGYLTKDYWSSNVPTPTTPSPTSLPTETPTEKTLKAAFDYDPKYGYILQDPSQTIEFKNLTGYAGDIKPACTWSIDSDSVSQDWNYSTKLKPGKNTVRLTARDGKTSDQSVEDIEVDEYGPGYAEKELKVPIKGTVYCTGVMEDWYQRRVSEPEMKENLSVIKNELRCNGVRIFGEDDDLVIKGGEIALDLGFDNVVLTPYWINRTAEETINKMNDFAKKAEQLRSTSNSVQLNISEEPSMTTRGIISDNQSWVTRGQLLDQWKVLPGWEKRLNNFLEELIKTTRKYFNGKILCGIGTWENSATNFGELDLDILGGSHFWYKSYGSIENPNNRYLEIIRLFQRFSKPYYVTEFGSATYMGAFERGATAWNATNVPYDEDEQVKAIDAYVTLFNRAKIDGVFLAEFGSNVPKPSDWGYGIVKHTSSRPDLVSRKKGYWKWAALAIKQ
jgi:hypothetical protein